MASSATRKARSRASPGLRDPRDISDGTAMVEMPRTRLNLIYKGTEMQELLEKLQRQGHHGTVTETIAKALRLYEAFLDERQNGNQIVIRGRNGSSDVRLI